GFRGQGPPVHHPADQRRRRPLTGDPVRDRTARLRPFRSMFLSREMLSIAGLIGRPRSRRPEGTRQTHTKRAVMDGHVHRGMLVALLVFAAGLIVPDGATSAEMALTVGKAAPNADPIIPVNVGDRLGIFKKHGLDLKIVDFSGGSKMTQAL